MRMWGTPVIGLDPMRFSPHPSRLWLALALAVGLGCASDKDAHIYQSAATAPSYNQTDIANLAHLGAQIVDQGVSFNVYSEHATKLQVALFQNANDPQPVRQIDMTQFGNVWSVYVEGIGVGRIYGYIAWGPNWVYDPNWYPGSIAGFQADVDSQGNRYNPNKLLFDPYSLGFTDGANWALGSEASGPDRATSDYAGSMKSVVVQSTYTWSSNEDTWRQNRQSTNFPGHNWNEQIIYEVHPKGFTASPASGVAHPGTFRGVGEAAGYLSDLGISAVELMPSFQKDPSNGGYWGYATVGFFAPELSYSNNPIVNTRDQPVDEFKWMVDQLHQNGIEVFMDVVFNHTGEGGLWEELIQEDDTIPEPDIEDELQAYDPKEVATIYSFRGLDNQAYYSLSADNQTYWNNTGVGDETRCNHTPMQHLIVDSLEYWVGQMHVDGFRFDLGPVLGETDGNYNVQANPANTVLQQIVDDPVLQKYNTRLVAEPWSLSAYMIGQFPASSDKDGTAWGEWNGPFRDWWRSFMNIDTWNLSDTQNNASGGFLIYGSQDWYAWNNRRPYNSVNFVTIHDGFTMYDLFSYDGKVNGCGPLNPLCCTDPTSPFCSANSGTTNNISRDWGSDPAGESMKRQLMRNLFVALLTSHGSPMLFGGDEWMRTQLGNNNAYSTLADNADNWFDWGTWEPSDFLQPDARLRPPRMIAFRKTHEYALSPSDYSSGAPLYWEDENGNQPPNWNSRHLAVHYYDDSFGPQIDILINMETGGPVTFQLPQGVNWGRVVDTQSYFDQDSYLTSNGLDLEQLPQRHGRQLHAAPITGNYAVQPRSIVILVEQP